MHVSNTEDVQVLRFYIKMIERTYQTERQVLLKQAQKSWSELEYWRTTMLSLLFQCPFKYSAEVTAYLAYGEGHTCLR